MTYPPWRSASTSAGPASVGAALSAIARQGRSASPSSTLVAAMVVRIDFAQCIVRRGTLDLVLGLDPSQALERRTHRALDDLVDVECAIAVGLRPTCRAHAAEVGEAPVEQVLGNDIAERAEDRVDTTRVLLLPLLHQRAHLLSLQVLLRAAE